MTSLSTMEMPLCRGRSTKLVKYEGLWSSLIPVAVIKHSETNQHVEERGFLVHTSRSQLTMREVREGT